MDRRRAPRYKTRFDTLCSTGEHEGAGVLCEISYVGARIEEANHHPELGTKVTLYIFIQPVAPFQISGHVARVTETGFAIHYDLFDEEVRRLVDDVAAIVSSPGDE